MTTKQPPAQKHLDVAKKTIEYWQDTHSFKIPSDIKHDMIIDFGESLAETEAAALAPELEIRKVLLRRIELLETHVIESGNTIKLTHESAPDMSQKEEKSDVSKEHVISNDISAPECVCGETHLHNCPVHAHLQDEQSAPTSEGFDIPEHQHTHSLYIHCLSCQMFGTPMPTRFIDAVECGSCGSMETVKYYPSCCIEADRIGQASRNIRLPEFPQVESYFNSIQCDNNYPNKNKIYGLYSWLTEQVIAMNKDAGK